MAGDVTSHVEKELREGLVQLRFADSEGAVHDLNAAEMAEVLQGLVELTSDLARDGAFGEGPPPEVRVRPPQQGSVILEAVLQLASSYPAEALTVATTTGGGLVTAINVGIKKLRGEEPSDVEEFSDGTLKVKWPGGRVDLVTRKAWDRFEKMPRRTRSSLRKLMAPMGDDVDTLEVRDAAVEEQTDEILRTDADVVATRRDYREAAAEADDIEETPEEFEAEAQLQSIDFRRGEKWRIRTLRGTKQATMADEEFLRQLDKGMALHKDDIFDVTIREVRTVKNGRTSRDWSLIRVVRKRRGSDDDSGEPATASAPSED